MFAGQVMVGAIGIDVTVGSAEPETLGSSVKTSPKLLPLTVPWVVTLQPEVNGLATVAWNVIVMLFPIGRVPILTVTGPPRKWVLVTLPGMAPTASSRAGRRRSPFVREPYIRLSRTCAPETSGRPTACP